MASLGDYLKGILAYGLSLFSGVESSIRERFTVGPSRLIPNAKQEVMIDLWGSQRTDKQLLLRFAQKIILARLGNDNGNVFLAAGNGGAGLRSFATVDYQIAWDLTERHITVAVAVTHVPYPMPWIVPFTITSSNAKIVDSFGRDIQSTEDVEARGIPAGFVLMSNGGGAPGNPVPASGIVPNSENGMATAQFSLLLFAQALGDPNVPIAIVSAPPVRGIGLGVDNTETSGA